MRPALLFALAACVLALFVMSCDGGKHAQPTVTIEPLPSSTPGLPTGFGGKPANDVAAASVPAAPEASATPEPPQDATAAPSAGAPQSAATPDLAPTTGRWIDVDVTRFVVRLMDGSSAVREIAPVAVGAQIDTGEYASTQTGLFHVYNKVADLVFDAPYNTYISNWVGFDPDKANGFHSFLKDKTGAVVDASTGRVSNGCIRTGAEEAIFAFAEVGMPVWVHS
jgi:hypothetical protein